MERGLGGKGDARELPGAAGVMIISRANVVTLLNRILIS